jgi:transposase-like protein
VISDVWDCLSRSTVSRRFVRTAPDGLLVVLDGAKGLRPTGGEVFADSAQVQRCQWHKRENVVRHLPLGQQATWRRKLLAGYEQPTYAKAKRALQRLGPH